MKKSVNLLLSDDEKVKLRERKIKISELIRFAPDEIASILKASPQRAKEINALIEFQSIPSLGINFATELIGQGYYSLKQLAGKDAIDLFDAFEKHVGAWADPCVEDSYRLLVHYIKHGETGKKWWNFTAERKAYRAEHGFPADRPARAWYELPEYKK
ncbi:pathogenicity locus Cdd1 protein [Mucilaginibacter oryzae]|uniref:Pathogenicity locus Cdd1 protein n=1 Tax=Mucilaginibacter oryzae TaxID=468058 RepID=A0A316HJ96_9SPHI|nr:helix-hairpin-helix domain-containing protein [Mucilaginibacter oryzae]PWK80566.1 pathogenicity locus Cdd1 protein [Mucilaginibacter oryzae]